MPFTKYIDFGPDKMETVASAKNEVKTSFDPMWAGTLMCGPLAMTATNITSWNEATLDIKSDLSDISIYKVENGDDSLSIYSLRCKGIEFFPDYYTDKHSTHYFRINLLGDPNAEKKIQLLEKIQEARCYDLACYDKNSVKALEAAISKVEGLSNKTVVSDEEMEEGLMLLRNRIAELKQVRLNPSALSAMIAHANKKNQELYTWDSYDELLKSLEKAKKVLAEKKSQKNIDFAAYKLKQEVQSLVLASSVDKSALKECLALAQERVKAQEMWNALVVKVPDFTPWAPYGFKRLVEQYTTSENVYHNKDKNYNQDEVNKAVAALNMLINTMRPGNLAELEDLEGLLAVLSKAKNQLNLGDKKVKDEIAYAEMVVRYVNQGSGTIDMIGNAEKRLNLLLK